MSRDLTVETMADLHARIAYGERPSRLYILATIPNAFRGAPQVVRGPPDVSSTGWRWCYWRADSEDPGGWPIRRRVCTKRTLPRWARRAVRGVR